LIELLFIFIRKDSFTVTQRCLKPILFHNSERYQVSIRLKDTFIPEPGPTGLFKLTAINSNNLYSVPWPHSVDIIIITNQVQRRWSLTLRDVLRQLLKFYILFICKMTIFVSDLVGVPKFTILTIFRLLDSCVLELHKFFCFALYTLKSCSFHLREYLTAPDYDSSKTDKPVDF